MNGNVPISGKPQNLALIFEIGNEYAENLKQADFSLLNNGQKSTALE